MFKKLVQKTGVFNPEISPQKLIDILRAHMPAWRWSIYKEKGDTFVIMGTKRWNELTILRVKDGFIYAKHDVRLRWAFITFGLAWIIGEARSAIHRHAAMTVLREHVEIGGKHGNG